MLEGLYKGSIRGGGGVEGFTLHTCWFGVSDGIVSDEDLRGLQKLRIGGQGLGIGLTIQGVRKFALGC